MPTFSCLEYEKKQSEERSLSRVTEDEEWKEDSEPPSLGKASMGKSVIQLEVTQNGDRVRCYRWGWGAGGGAGKGWVGVEIGVEVGVEAGSWGWRGGWQRSWAAVGLVWAHRVLS